MITLEKPWYQSFGELPSHSDEDSSKKYIRLNVLRKKIQMKLQRGVQNKKKAPSAQTTRVRRFGCAQRELEDVMFTFEQCGVM